MLTVACVLRSGGVYTPDWVCRLHRAVSAALCQSFDFVCLTDFADVVWPAGIRAVPLVNGWPGYWSKIELFRPHLFTGNVLYLDLDSIITGSLEPLVRYADGLTMARDFYRPAGNNSCVMSFRGDLGDIYDLFATRPKATQRAYDQWPDGRVGDQAFIEDVMIGRVQTFPDGLIASYKKHAVTCCPKDALVVQFHGSPKPCDIKAGWVADHWKGNQTC